mgnify:CR=1 FL=1
MRRALVLAGGGLAGIAWETGVLRGVADEDPALAAALVSSDVLLGTSAGSAVAAQVGSGVSLERLFARQVRADSGELHPGNSMDRVVELFLSALLLPDATKQQKLQHIGSMMSGSRSMGGASPARTFPKIWRANIRQQPRHCSISAFSIRPVRAAKVFTPAMRPARPSSSPIMAMTIGR